MNPNTLTLRMRFLASAALACFFAMNMMTTAAFSQVISKDSDHPATPNPYTIAGEQFLSQLQQAFLEDTLRPGANLKLYANTINPNDGSKNPGVAFLWTQDQMIRALYWGARVDPKEFKLLLATAVDQTNWYQGGCGTGFGTTRNATCFYDDNSLLGGILMDVYLHQLLTTDVYSHSRDALNYVFDAAAQDPHGGVPQVPAKLGQGHYYMNVVVRISLADVDHGIRFNNSDEVAIGRKYFNQVNDPALGLITKGGLFKSGTQFVSGEWQSA